MDMNNPPFFSIIVPVYKVEPYLSACVDSILKQTFTDFELILVDDGSPDRCPQICDNYAAQDSRVVVIHKPNGGPSSARNVGMQIARGKYISFLDSDDFWIYKTILEDLHRIFSFFPYSVAIIKSVNYYQDSDSFSNRFNSFSDADFSGPDYESRLLDLVSALVYRANPWNKVFARTLIEKGNLFFTEGIIAEDIDWAARLCLCAESITILPKVVHAYRAGRPGSITSSLKLKNLVDTKGSIERCLDYVKALPLSEKFEFAYYSYVAYRYIIWMAESAALKDPAKKPLIREMKRYSWLLHYDGIRRVHTVRRLYRILGYRLTALLLGIYLKNRS